MSPRGSSQKPGGEYKAHVWVKITTKGKSYTYEMTGKLNVKKKPLDTKTEREHQRVRMLELFFVCAAILTAQHLIKNTLKLFSSYIIYIYKNICFIDGALENMHHTYKKLSTASLSYILLANYDT